MVEHHKVSIVQTVHMHCYPYKNIAGTFRACWQESLLYAKHMSKVPMTNINKFVDIRVVVQA